MPALRRPARAAARGAPALLGGEVAQAYDTHEALDARTQPDRADRRSSLILLVVIVLLRALVMPLYLIATVMLSLRVRARRERARVHRGDGDGRHRHDPADPFAFIFLVALGVDYNIFLIHRIKEESLKGDSRRA